MGYSCFLVLLCKYIQWDLWMVVHFHSSTLMKYKKFHFRASLNISTEAVYSDIMKILFFFSVFYHSFTWENKCLHYKLQCMSLYGINSIWSLKLPLILYIWIHTWMLNVKFQSLFNFYLVLICKHNMLLV